MPPKAKKVEAVEIAPIVVEKTDPTDTDLLALYLKDRQKSRADLTEFTHAKYESWLHYFGFSLEQELRWGTQDGSKSLRSTQSRKKTSFAMPRSPESHTKPGLVLPPITIGGSDSPGDAAAAPQHASKEGTDPFASTPAVPEACYGVPVDVSSADERALSVGPLSQLHTLAAVVDTLVAPFKLVTWRQSHSLCLHLKTRVVYRWLCEHVKLLPPAGKPGGAGGLLAADAATTAAASKEASKKAAAKPAKGAVATDLGPAVPTGVTGSQATLVSRAGDAVAVAQLFSDMLQACGVAAETVRGTLKGTLDQLGKPVGFMPWAWNIVHLPAADDEPPQTAAAPSASGKPGATTAGPALSKFLVDVALSSAYISAGAGEGPATPNAAPAVTSPNATAMAVPPPVVPGVIKFNEPVDYTPVFEPWYYFTKPQHFVSLHFPDETHLTLLSRVVSRTHWEVYPRLSHSFFKLHIRLDSHKRRTVFTAKVAPLYVSFLLDEPLETDMCLVVFRGPAVPQSLNAALQGSNTTAAAAAAAAASSGGAPQPMPIEPKFIWQQRQEAERRLTFSVMTPDVGIYSLVFGARRVNTSVQQSELPQTPFDAVCVYQVMVNFVPVNEPMFPRQLMAPSLLKLVEPLQYKVLAGEQHFTVVPTCCNILAVAVVNRIYKVAASGAKGQAGPAAGPQPPTTGDLSGRKAGGKPNKQAAAQEAAAVAAAAAAAASSSASPSAPVKNEVERSTYRLLPLDPTRCVFAGPVPLAVGLVEVWAFYGDPTTMVVGKGSSGGAGSALLDGIVDRPGSATSKTAEGSAVPAPPASPGKAGAKPLTSNLIGAFYPAITEIQVVKRIPAKELSLNEGRPLIHPTISPVTDTAATLRLITGVNDTARTELQELRVKPMVAVGSYFAPSATSFNKTKTV